MSKLGGMQLTKKYKNQLPQNFLDWYFKTFTSTRMHYGHWSVGCYDQNWDEYEEVIEDDPNAKWHNEIHLHDNKAHLVRNGDPSEDFNAHTWRRNSNSWSTCFASMVGGNAYNLGDCPPTPDEIRLFINVSITDHINLHVPVGNFMGHGEAADNMEASPENRYQGNQKGNDNAAIDLGLPHANYGPASDFFMRWDLHCWVDPNTLELTSGFGKQPEGWEYLCDYIRGNIILGIMNQTKTKWNK